jgi:hypothetical protein
MSTEVAPPLIGLTELSGVLITIGLLRPLGTRVPQQQAAQQATV